MPKPSADLPNTQVIPKPISEKRTRRAFTTDYKLRILAEADNCAYGQLGALLRRENLYSSQLREWRQEMAAHGIEKLSKTHPGPAPANTSAARYVEQLEKENGRLRKRLQMAEDCLDLQKKVLSMLDQANTGNAV
jgi:transposase-like protein